MSLKWTVLVLLVAGTIMAGCSRAPVEAVHEIVLYVGDAPQGSGSGVMIAPRLMITAAHVAEEGYDIMVGPGKVKAKVLKSDPEKDLALLELDMDCPCASVGESPEPGREVVAVGFPRYDIFGIAVVTSGESQGIGKNMSDGKLIYTAPGASGSSGGGVFVWTWNGGWRLVGIVVGQGGESTNTPFVQTRLAHLMIAVGADEIKRFLGAA